MTRTRDLLITNELHYQLCYTSTMILYQQRLEKSRGALKKFFEKNFFLLCYNRYVTKKEDKQPQICYDVNNHKNT